MVKSLFKYEFYYYRRILPIIYAVVLGLGVLNMMLSLFASDTLLFSVLYGFSITFYFLAIVASIILTIIISIVRFYNNIYSAEGYVTLTFPVTPASHILVKASSAVIAQVATAVVAFVSFLIIFPSEVYDAFKAIFEALFSETFAIIIKQFGIFLTEGIILLIVGSFTSILLVYACISLGQLGNKNKVLLAVVAYFAHNAIIQFITSIFSAILAVIDAANDDFWLGSLVHFIDKQPETFLHIAFAISLVISGILCTIYWAITHKVLSTKVNLS
ncbi:MAG: hypothetical protein MJ236_05770 [Clostridia bacterium]|nr:hypothetical protein [Clostridia bacterium]